MKVLTSIVVLFLSLNLTSQSQFFISFPSLSPDAKTVVFCYESDIWKADLATGLASRLTSMQGVETRPKISPDGAWLAFSSTQFGSSDVYLMPLDGGDIKQLTYSDGADLVESWSWDSQTIYFQNNALNGGTAYVVSIKGGTPKKLFDHYFNRIHNVVEAPNKDIYFNDTWESANQAYRKRYKGAFNPEIQSYNLTSKKYKQHTNHLGKDMWPTIDKAGEVYYVSDEKNGHYNLYQLEGKIALTTFDESIKYPQVSANGGKLVFVKGYQLWAFDTKTKKASQVKLKLVRNELLTKEQDFEVNANITNFDIAPDGKKMAFVSRGRLFVSDLKGKFVKELATSSTERVQEVKWVNKDSLVYTETVKGYPNLFMAKADGSGKAKKLTDDAKSNRHLTLNHDKTMIAFISGRDELKVFEIKSDSIKLIAKDEFWAIQSDAPSWSPNGDLIMYQAYRDFEKDMFIVDVNTKITKNISQSGVSETQALWAPDGESIYFVSNRLKPFYPFGFDQAHIYKLPLVKKINNLKSDKFDALWKTEKKATKDSNQVLKTEIDYDKMMERIVAVGPSIGAQYNLYLSKSGDKTTLFYVSDHDEGKAALWKTESEPFEADKTSKITDLFSFSMVEADKKLYVLTRGKIATLNGDKLENIEINHKFLKNNREEFEQMFHETWAGVEENFYNESFHGLDWKKVKATYQSYLPYVTNRADLREMMQDMLGELNSSHTGFSSNGNEENIFHKNATAQTGIIWDNQKPFTVAKLLKRTPVDQTKIDIKPGFELTKVNGEEIDKTVNRDYYFSKPSLDAELMLTFKGDTGEVTIKLPTITTASLQNQLYENWIDTNQETVDKLSDNQVAYVHMRNMGQEEYEKFVSDMTQDFYKKKALILDLRYNTGGNVHDKVLNFLSQKPYLTWKYREGKLTNQPNFSPAGKPIILLINEQSLSDAEMTAEGFKTLGLGKIIGTETYRWIIFTSGKGLVDGSFYRLPSWGCYSLDGKRNLELTGVAPDIYVKQSFTDRLEGQDPQIERAIQEIKKMW